MSKTKDKKKKSKRAVAHYQHVTALIEAYASYDVDRIGEINTQLRQSYSDEQIRHWNAVSVSDARKRMTEQALVADDETYNAMVQILEDLTGTRTLVPE